MSTENNKAKINVEYRARIRVVKDIEHLEIPRGALQLKTEVNVESAVMIVSWLERA